jgi:hypothetical protein
LCVKFFFVCVFWNIFFLHLFYLSLVLGHHGVFHIKAIMHLSSQLLFTMISILHYPPSPNSTSFFPWFFIMIIVSCVHVFFGYVFLFVDFFNAGSSMLAILNCILHLHTM